MTQPTVKKNNRFISKTAVLITLLVMLVLVIAWHIVLPLLGISIVISAGVWGVAVTSIVLLCVCTLLFFLFTGIGVFVVGFFALVWTAIAIILFPLLFPVLVPILLLMVLIALMAKNKSQ
jgi:hypothetical protein